MAARTWIAVSVLLAAAAGAAALLRPASPVAAALAAHLDDGASAANDRPLRSSINPGKELRARSWVVSGPNQPEGIALFIDLPDAVLGPERQVTSVELAPTLARIRGRRWDAASRSWLDPAGQLQPVALATVQEGLESACAQPQDARAVVDLLTGQAAPGVPAVAGRLMDPHEPLPRLRFVTVSGRHGQMMLADSPPPYRSVERAYEGLLLRFDGPGWPESWRVMDLRSVGR